MISQAAAVSGARVAGVSAKAAPARAPAMMPRIVASSVSASRRSVAFGAALIPAVVSLPALALIPDDEDEELLAKAKANRQKRLAEEREVEKAFVREEGFKAKNDAASIAYVQQGVTKLAKVGSLLEKGDLGGVAAVARDGKWVADFTSAAAALGGNDKAKSSAAAFTASVAALGASASKNNASGAKSDFIKAVDAIEDYTSTTGIQGRLKGL